MNEAKELRPDYYKVQVRVMTPQSGAHGQIAQLECFDLIDALKLPYYAATALKYLFRWGRKSAGHSNPQVTDLRKALTFIQQSIIRETTNETK